MRLRLITAIAWMATSVSIAAIIAATTPTFSKDAQYYLQSGFLWADGKVSYAASLIGSRVYAVVYYNAFQSAFGPSIDAVSLALAATYLVFCLSAWLMARALVDQSYAANTLAVGFCVFGFLWLDWMRPLTEPFLVVVVMLSLVTHVMSCSATSDRVSLAWAIASAAICGLGLGFRAELTLLFILITAANVFLQFTRRSRRHAIFAAASMVAIYLVLAAGPQLVFRTFTGKSMPPQLSGYLLLFKTVEGFGKPHNGPASAELYRLGSQVAQKIPGLQNINPMRLGLSGAYMDGGATFANKLFVDAGLETLRSSAVDVVRGTMLAFAEYILFHNGDASFKILNDSSSIAKARETLSHIDLERAAQSITRFGGDYFWPVATIVDSRNPIGKALDAVPTVSANLSLPAWLVTVLAIAAYAVERRRNGPVNLVLVVALFHIGSCLVAAFSQGFVQRYWLPSSFCLTLISVAAIAGSVKFEPAILAMNDGRPK